MDKVTRESVFNLLARDWANYVGKFQRLPPAAQTAFLERQGYKRLADLLAHIVAWWEEGMQAIQRFKYDPAARQPQIDIDGFNARAVEKARGVSDEEEIRIFEEARESFIKVVQTLSEDDFRDERVLTQLKWELVNHLEEHRI